MPDLNWTLAALCAAAFFAGVMNSIAGGGTLLTFPALTGVLSDAMANGTSTVALLPGSVAGAVGYRKELWECRRFVLRMLAPSIVGGYLGAGSSAATSRLSPGSYRGSYLPRQSFSWCRRRSRRG